MRGLFKCTPCFGSWLRVGPDKIDSASLGSLRRKNAGLLAARLRQYVALLSWVVGRDEGHHFVRFAALSRADAGGAKFFQPQKRFADAVAHAGFVIGRN